MPRPNAPQPWRKVKKCQKTTKAATTTTTAATPTALAVKVFQFFVSSSHLHVNICVCVSSLKYECICICACFSVFFLPICRLPFSLFATRIGTSGGRSASSSAFALAQITAHNFHITSAHLECVESPPPALSICLCVCVCVYILHILRLPHVYAALRLWPLAYVVILRYGNQYS